MIEYPHGMPSWVELGSPDLDASAAFYRDLFGWRTAMGEHRMFELEGEVVAGLGPLREGQPPSWTTYMSVDDAAATVANVEAAGGTTVSAPLALADAGAEAVFADAAGAAVFAVWQPGVHRGAQVMNAVGALTMNELRTRDVEAAARFYGDVFGWELVPIEQGGAVVYGSFRLGGRLIAGLLPMGEGFPPQVPAMWVPYFGVEDVDAGAARVQELGGALMAGPMAVPAGRFATVTDRHGALFSLFEGRYDPPPGS